jgi:ribonucleoside-diphosphate reductase alpha chain
VFDPRGGQWMDGRYVPSLLAAIGEVIERHMIDIGFMTPPEERKYSSEVLARAVGETGSRLRQCPRCAQAAVVHQEGCDLCTSCGYSKCA